MKKIIVIAMLLSFVASSAFAATLTATDAQAGLSLQATSPVNTLIGKTSKGVRLSATFETTAYAMMTVHLNGSKYYGTAYDSTAIMVSSPAGDINASFSAPSSSVASAAFGTGWSAL